MNCAFWPKPIQSMYGIFTYIWLILMVNVGLNKTYMDSMGNGARHRITKAHGIGFFIIFFLRFVIQLQRLRVFVWNLVQHEPAPLGTNAIKMDKIPEDRQQITCVLYSTGECRISAIRSR